MFCSIDPLFLEANGIESEKTLMDLKDIEDPVLKDLILENSVFNTTLAPAEARSLLPCLDEPSFKAVF